MQQPERAYLSAGSSEQAQTSRRVRFLLIAAGFSNEDAAIGIGVDEQTVLDWCRGIAEPPLPVIYALEHLVAAQLRAGKQSILPRDAKMLDPGCCR